MSRSALLIGSFAFLLTSAAPPPLPPSAPSGQRAASQDHSPVRCNERREERNRGGVTGSVPQQYAPPPAPPPPPTPPPPLMAPPPAPSAGPIVVTGVRASLQNSTGVRANADYGAPGNTERYDGNPVSNVLAVAAQPVSTFSVDVDTGAYANVRRFLNQRQAVPPEAVRTEEMINYFRYDYPLPARRDAPFSVTTNVTQTPWNPNTRLLRIGLRGYDVTAEGRPAANLVFLIDVSGSMSSPDKLPLVKHALTLLASRLTPRDKVSIVVYAGAAGVVLEPTSNADDIRGAIACLEAGGSTAGAQGITLAYNVARANFIPGGINRIMLATDGDFNVGISNNRALEELVKRQRDSGITLTTLGFGQGNYNEAMMERIADVGNGNYCYIDSEMEAQKVLDDELSATLFTIASDVKVQVEFNPAQVSEYRLIGYENRALREEDFNNDAVDAGDIGAGHQVTALYEIVPAGSPGWLADRRYAGNRTAAPTGRGSELAFVKLRYKLPGQDRSRLISTPVAAALIRSAPYPSGDMAFVTAVAAFGQKLRGDTYLNGFGFSQIATLAGGSTDYWRSEFVRLVRLADAQVARPARGD